MNAFFAKHAKYEAFVGRGLQGFQNRRPSVELQPTGITDLDAVLGGGFLRGSLVELYGPASSGRTSLAFSLLAQATERQEACAFVDVSDSLDPVSLAAAGVELPRLLWIRCGENQGRETDLKASSCLSPVNQETKRVSAPDSSKRLMPKHGWRHPRESMRGVDKAIPSLVGKQPVPAESAQIHIVARCAEEQVERDREPPRRGIRPQRPLPSLPKFDPPPPRQTQRGRSTTPWKRLEQALKTTDLLLHGGGWGVVVFDLGGVSWVDARRIETSIWFRFRRAIENTPTILLLLGEESFAKSCASLVLRCQRKAEHWSRAATRGDTGATTFEGFEVQGEVTRSRVLSQPADSARWQTRTP